ncbi:MAG: 3-hydroxyacyl-CoA dehydrogenase NAD-binding domain-containing protein, partial [Pseudomonadota bacterium]
MAAADPPYVVILGAGAIGVSFAACFLDAGARVTLVEPDKTRHGGLGTALKTQQDAIKTAGLAASLAGDLAIASAPPGDLAQSTIVLECGPERLEVKQATFAEMLAKTGDGTVLATASSAIPMSRILPAPADQARCLVTHPVNPPAALRLVELAPAPATSPAVVAKAAGIFASLGFTTVTLHHEVEGFILNRLQGAVLREAYRLVDD